MLPSVHNGNTTLKEGVGRELQYPLEHIRTTGERDLFVAQLEELDPHLDKKSPLSSLAPRCLSHDNAQALLMAATQSKVADDDATETRALIQRLAAHLKSVPVVELTIATTYAEKEVAGIYEWFERHVEKKVILEIKVDRSIAAGALVAARGRYRDFSLKQLDSSE